MSKVVKSRSYDNSRRLAGARETRRSIVRAAHDLFFELGYPGTTFLAIGDQAGVSVQTVYSHFKTKCDLLKEVLNQALTGDDEPVALADRSEVARIRAEPRGAQKLRLHAAFVTSIMQRAAALDGVLRTAAAVDPEAEKLWSRQARQKYAGMLEFAAHLAEGGHIRDGLTVRQVADRISALMDPEIYRVTVSVNGWTPMQYEEWLSELLCASVVRPPPAEPGAADGMSVQR